MTDTIRTNFCPGCKTLADDLEAMTNARNDALAEVETMEVHLSIHRLEIERLRNTLSLIYSHTDCEYAHSTAGEVLEHLGLKAALGGQP